MTAPGALTYGETYVSRFEKSLFFALGCLFFAAGVAPDPTTPGWQQAFANPATGDERGGSDGRKKDITVSVVRLIRMARREFVRFENDSTSKGYQIIVEGFSASMSEYILGLKFENPRLLKRIFRALENIRDTKKRATYLKREKARLEKTKKVLEQSINRLKSRLTGDRKNDTLIKQAIRDDLRRSHMLDRVIEDLDVWSRYPHEGLR